MNRKDLIVRLSYLTGYPQKECSVFVHTIFDTIRDEICSERVVQIKGFGTFGVHKKKSRKFYSPVKKEFLESEASFVPYFRAAAGLKKDVKKNLVIRV